MGYIETTTTETIETTTTSDDSVSTGNVATSAPTTLFLTLASGNSRAMSIFVSEVKNACNEFATDVCALVGYEKDYDDTDSDYCDSDINDSDSEIDPGSEIDPDSELTKKIVANEFEPIIADLKNMIQSLEQRYLAAKGAFNCHMSKEIENFKNSCITIAMGM